MSMSLVNQSSRLIAILLQFFLYQTRNRTEDLVTIRKKLFWLYPWILLLYLLNCNIVIQFKNYVSEFHNPNLQFIRVFGYKLRESIIFLESFIER